MRMKTELPQESKYDQHGSTNLQNQNPEEMVPLSPGEARPLAGLSRDENSVMKRVYSSLLRSTADYVKHVLEEVGIPCIARGEFSPPAITETSPFEYWPGIWVVNDADEKRALQIIIEIEKSEDRKRR